jgi:hypothetical protein
MPTTKYIPLFEVQMQHTYYTNGRCAALVMQPTPDTAALCRRLGLLYRPLPHGGAIYGDVEKMGNDWRLKQPLPKNTAMRFSLTDISGSFYSITQWPLEYNPKELLVFTNYLQRHLFDGNTLLHKPSAQHNFGPDDLYEKALGSYTFTKNLAAAATVTITHLATGKQLSQNVLSHMGAIAASFNLANTDAGFATLSVNGTPEKTLYLLPSGAAANTLGIVEILYKPELDAAYQFMTPTGQVNSKVYTIAFAALTARWRYRVDCKFSDNISTVTVAKSNPGAINFDTLAAPGGTSFVCTSTAALALRQQPITGIALKNQAQKTIIPHLPNPSVQQIVADPDGHQYADMLVTI